jgi:hypothetical protein
MVGEWISEINVARKREANKPDLQLILVFGVPRLTLVSIAPTQVFARSEDSGCEPGTV